MTDRQLLDLRLCDLPLQIKGTHLEQRIEKLYREFDARSLSFRPHIWLAEEWFTPDGVAGFAIPFYLAHPRLMKLERAQMLEVEGAGEAECMRILRHEAVHAIDNAFRLHSSRTWSDTFGSYRVPYPEWYQPQPGSRDYVLNLDAWYAQAHPAEDFAETFAVWLQPRSNWRRRYRSWPAIHKLEYVDEVLKEIAGTRPKNRVRRKVETLPEIRTTLRKHYARKKRQYEFQWPAYLDADLRRIFSNDPRHKSRRTAASFLRSIKREVEQLVADGTSVHKYAIDHVFELMIERAVQLKLRVTGSREQARREVMIMLTVQTMNVVHSGYHRIAL